MNDHSDNAEEIVGIIGVFNGEVPYLKRHPGAKLYPGGWCIPSGHMEIGESAEEAARRELEEEIGYKMPAEAKMEELGRFTYTIDTNGKNLKLKITLFLHMAEDRPEIRLCNEHTEYKYISIGILSDKEKMFLYSHSRGTQDFTPIDLMIINDYIPKAYEAYRTATKSRTKSTA